MSYCLRDCCSCDSVSVRSDRYYYNFMVIYVCESPMIMFTRTLVVVNNVTGALDKFRFTKTFFLWDSYNTGQGPFKARASGARSHRVATLSR